MNEWGLEPVISRLEQIRRGDISMFSLSNVSSKLNLGSSYITVNALPPLSITWVVLGKAEIFPQ